MTHPKNRLYSKSDSGKAEQADVLDLLREWIDKNINYGSIKPEIFVKNGVAYAFTLHRGDETIHHETGDTI